MKKILFSLLTLFAICSVAGAQEPADMYYVVNYRYEYSVHNANDGTFYRKESFATVKNIGIDNNHNVYLLVGENNPREKGSSYSVYKNGKLYQALNAVSLDHFYSSMAMKVVGNDVVVAGVESRLFNDKGYESRMVGYVNGELVYQTDWHRKSLKREKFKGYSEILYWEGKPSGIAAVEGFNSIRGEYSGADRKSLVYYVSAVDYVDGNIYTTGWGEREYSETHVGYNTVYFVRRCPRVWKNGKEIVQQYENRTGAGYSINVMRNGKNILTSGHQRGHICGWDGNKVMFSSNLNDTKVLKEAVIFNGMADGTPLFTRMFISNNDNILYMVNTAKNGKQEPVYVEGSKIVDVVAVGNDFYALSARNKKIYKFSSSNWLSGNFEKSTVKKIDEPDEGGSYALLAVHN